MRDRIILFRHTVTESTLSAPPEGDRVLVWFADGRAPDFARREGMMWDGNWDRPHAVSQGDKWCKVPTVEART